MKHLVTAAAISLLALCACSKEEAQSAPEKVEAIAPTPAIDPQPALWLVQDEDTKVFLFGTVHVLKPETQWKTPEIEHAILDANAVYQEADISKDAQQKISLLLPSLAFYSYGNTLKDDLDDTVEDEIYEVANDLGLPAASMDKMQPWFAGVALSQMHIVKSGYQADSGVETKVTSLAKGANIPIRYFETAEQQILFFAKLPMTDQAAFLEATAKGIQETPDLLDDLVTDWLEGDVNGIAAIMASESAMGNDAIIDTLLTQRNIKWAQTIDTLLDEEAGTFFVAVGAGHLAGSNSVIQMLKDRGETVIRN